MVLDYLSSFPVVLKTQARIPDVLSQSNERVIPVYFRSDGQWVWNAAFEHYISNYQLAPPQEFLTSSQLTFRNASRQTKSCEALLR